MEKHANNLPGQLRLTVTKFADKTAVQIKDEQQIHSYTYQELWSKVEQYAKSLVSLGVKSGDRVAIMRENGVEWAAIYFAVLLTGAVVVPIDPKSSCADIEYFLENSQTKLLFVDIDLLKSCQAAYNLKTLEKIVVSNDSKQKESNKIISFSEFLEFGGEQINFPKIESDALATIVYTSGTTGKPKGVMLTHENLLSNYQSVKELKFFGEDHNVLAILPLHHTFPLMVNLLLPLLVGATITFVASLKREDVLSALREQKITALVAVPEFYYLIAHSIEQKLSARPFYQRCLFHSMLQSNAAISKLLPLNLGKVFFAKLHQRFGDSLRYMVCGGAHIDAKVVRMFLNLGFTFIEGYGLSETSPAVSFNPPNRIKPGSVGKVIPGVELKILNPDKDGIGEVLIKGPNVMFGYWQREDATQEALKDDWFYSGDLGRLDSDGYLYLYGRKNEMIVLANGKNITPEVVETHYSQSQYIQELCVLKIGEGKDERLMAVIVPNMQAFKERGEINLRGLIRWDMENFAVKLPSYQRVLGFVITKEPLPRTRLGKLRRFLIREQFSKRMLSDEVLEEEAAEAIMPESLSEEDLALLNNPATSTVLQIFQQAVAGQRQLKLSDNLELDLAIDSLQRMELFAQIEKALRVKFSEDAMAKIFTVRDIANQIIKLTAGTTLELSDVKEVEKPEKLWPQIMQTPAPTELLEKITYKPPFWVKFLVLAGDGLLWFLGKVFLRLETAMEEPLPRDKAFIICANHSSYLDGTLVRAALPWQLKVKSFFFLHRAFVRNVVIWCFKVMHVIPISPAAVLDAFKVSASILKADNVLVIFPEGERSIDGKIKNFHNGIGIIAKEMNVPIMPLYIQGNFEVWPRGTKWPRPRKVKMQFGKMQNLDELLKLGRKLGAEDDYEAITQGIKSVLISYQSSVTSC